MTRTTLLITNDRGRVHLLARAERSLPQGEVIVQVKDLVGLRRAFRTTPRSPKAELVAQEPPSSSAAASRASSATTASQRTT